MFRRFVLLTSIVVSLSSAAAIRLPEASPEQSVSQEVGISKVTVAYHRPAVKGRTVWGDLVPLRKVWRLGANNATTIELSHDAKVGGHNVPAGKYSLFAIPAAADWTFIVNKRHEQWGAYFYKQEEDLVRFTVSPQTSSFRERFDIDLAPVDDSSLTMTIEWEKVRLPIMITFDTPALVWKHIDTELAAAKPDDWEVFHQAARHALKTGQRLDDAMRWVDQAMVKESFWNYELKGLLLRKLGRTEEAIPLMEKAKELARGKAPQEWIDGVDRELASWKKQ